MIYLLTLLTLLSLGILVVLLLKNAELKGQINKSLEGNADNLSDQLSFQLESFAKANQLETTRQLNQLQKELYRQLTDIREVLHQNLSDNRDRSDQRLEQINQSLTKAVKEMQDSNECVRQLKRNLSKHYRHDYKLPLRRCQDSWSLLTKVWGK